MAQGSGTGMIPMQKAIEVFGGMRIRWNALTPGRRTSFSAGVLLIVATVLALAWYMSRTEWRVLFSGLEGRDVAQVSQELAAAGIPLRPTADGGGVEVPAELLDKARMEVASKGMPESGRLGFELFDKPNWVGSEFDEKVNYQRALEGELEHTIATLGIVHSARVHLVLPKENLFTNEGRIAKAAVVLKLRHASMPREQMDSIRNLVAGAVENLDPQQVTLVDADGRISFTSNGQDHAEGDQQQALEAKLIAMLEPLAGTGNVHATVNISYDEGREERTDEAYDPAQVAMLTSQKSEQTSGQSRSSQGVPGTASNSPEAAPAAPIRAGEQALAADAPPLLRKSSQPVFPQNGAGAAQMSREESSTYAVTKHIVHTELGAGRVRRVTAAVVVNDRMTTEDSGKTTHVVWKARTSEEMHRLESLAQAAVGFDESRGDHVVIQNVSFSTNVPEVKSAGFEKVLEEVKRLLSQPANLKVLTISGLSLVLVLFVLRPIASQTVMTMREPLALSPLSSISSADVNTATIELDRSAPAPVPMKHLDGEKERSQPNQAPTNREMLAEVTHQIRRQPVQSTRLLETWISADGEGD